jgi:hypothetical protein
MPKAFQQCNFECWSIQQLCLLLMERIYAHLPPLLLQDADMFGAVLDHDPSKQYLDLLTPAVN